ncbi:MAG: peptidylprolyl isomerase [Candidatus Latescibacteria bacterium]|nr:peptidylprolyl isomerase [Candidatus Latescibacterota bacterium]
MRGSIAAPLLVLALGLSGCGDPCADQVDRDYLEKAAAVKGAVTTESGLIYQEVVAGTGPSPGPTDIVAVRYSGKLINGKEFDYTASYRKPRKVGLEKAVPGWGEGLQLMKEGGKAKLVIPPHLGYGHKGKKLSIPGCAVLIFDIELEGIEAGEVAATKE